MSRSYRHTMIHGNATSCSEKQDKRLNNRRLRRRVRQSLDTCTDFDAVILPAVFDVSNPWGMAKDGKRYSEWLAGYRATLAKVTRTRDGRTRYFLAVTERTLDHHDKKISNRRRIFLGIRLYREDVTIEELRADNPLSRPLDIIRK